MQAGSAAPKRKESAAGTADDDGAPRKRSKQTTSNSSGGGGADGSSGGGTSALAVALQTVLEEGTGGVRASPDAAADFVKLANGENTLDGRSVLLKVLQNTKAVVLKDLVAAGLPATLDAWLSNAKAESKVAMLRALLKRVTKLPLTVKALDSCSIGRTVGGLRKFASSGTKAGTPAAAKADEEVRTLAKNLVSHWKDIVDGTETKKPPSNAEKAGGSGGVEPAAEEPRKVSSDAAGAGTAVEPKKEASPADPRSGGKLSSEPASTSLTPPAASPSDASASAGTSAATPNSAGAPPAAATTVGNITTPGSTSSPTLSRFVGLEQIMLGTTRSGPLTAAKLAAEASARGDEQSKNLPGFVSTKIAYPNMKKGDSDEQPKSQASKSVRWAAPTKLEEIRTFVKDEIYGAASTQDADSRGDAVGDGSAGLSMPANAQPSMMPSSMPYGAPMAQLSMFPPYGTSADYHAHSQQHMHWRDREKQMERELVMRKHADENIFLQQRLSSMAPTIHWYEPKVLHQSSWQPDPTESTEARDQESRCRSVPSCLSWLDPNNPPMTPQEAPNLGESVQNGGGIDKNLLNLLVNNPSLVANLQSGLANASPSLSQPAVASTAYGGVPAMMQPPPLPSATTSYYQATTMPPAMTAAALAPAPQRQVMCKFFNSAGGCRLGTKCRFLHSSTQ